MKLTIFTTLVLTVALFSCNTMNNKNSRTLQPILLQCMNIQQTLSPAGSALRIVPVKKAKAGWKTTGQKDILLI